MKKTTRLLLCIIFIPLFCTNATGENWHSLFNGQNLNGWDTYLGPKYNMEQKDFTGKAIGLNNDPYKVFTVVKQNGKSAIRISGQHYGGISTKKEFSNYHLKLQFKWGNKKYAPRLDAKRDSGLLYHAHGEHAKDWYFWMKSMEMQIQEGDSGDYWGLGTKVSINAVKPQGSKFYQYVKNAPLVTFSHHLNTGRHVIKADNGDSEKPNGVWNTLELYTVNGNSVHIVNNVVKMILINSRKTVGDKELPLRKGKIQIQSEGAEVFYRDIIIREVDAIPDQYLN